MAKPPRAAAPRFDLATLRDLAGAAAFGRGERYHRDGQAELIADDGSSLSARVTGSEVYRVALRGGGEDIDGTCSCPAFAQGDFCKHLVATALAANAAAAAGTAVPDRVGQMRAHLRGLGAERLAELLLDAAERDPALFDRLELAARLAGGDPRQIGAQSRALLQQALRTGRYVDYENTGGWAQGVLDALDQIETLIDNGHAALVLDLLDDAFAEIAEALQHVDDSDGGGSEILARAHGLHLAAATAARPDPVAFAADLFRLETTEEFGTFAGALASYGDLLGQAGRAAYRQLAEAAWAKLPRPAQRRSGASTFDNDSMARYRLFPILDQLAAGDGDLRRRIALRESTLVHPHEHLDLAKFCLSHGLESEALRRAEEAAWLFDDAAGDALPLFLAERYRAGGDADKALAVLWPGFERQPSLALFAALAQAGAGEGVAITDRAVALLEARLAALKGKPGFAGHGPAGLLIEILLRAQRQPDAWAAARRHGCADAVWLQLATASETTAPDDALAVYARLAEQQIGLVDKNGYREACRLLGRMRAVQAARGNAKAFSAHLDAMLLRHKAKRNFVAMLRETFVSA